MSDKKDLHWQKRQGRIKDENISNKENEVEIMEKTMDKIIAVAKARGFVYQGLKFMAVWRIHGTTEILA